MALVNVFCLVPTCKRLVPGAIPTNNLRFLIIRAPRHELVLHELKLQPEYTSLKDFTY